MLENLWDYLWPFICVIAIIIIPILVLSILSIPAAWYTMRKIRISEAEFINVMKSKGRYSPWTAIESKLNKGEGMLFAESLSPKGPIRIWWAPEIFLPTSFHLPDRHDNSNLYETEPYKKYVSELIQKYSDEEGGMGTLTDFSGDIVDKLSNKSYKIIEVTRWGGDPFVSIKNVQTDIKDSSP